MATRKLATWAVNLQYSTLPPAVVSSAIESIYNWLGCAIGGCNHPAATIANTTLSPFFGTTGTTGTTTTPTSSILGFRGKQRADAQHAALINGIASHVHDYDDTHLETIIHPTGPVAAAALAYAEAKKGGVSGKDLIVAVVAGIEAECKVGLGIGSAHYDVGWHITSTTGSIGAAVAVGKLIGLDDDVPSMQHAIGIAATQVTGLREMFGSHTKSFHAGRAAQNGLLAAMLASNGYTSSLHALEAKRGWANVVSSTNNLDMYIDTLGDDDNVWEIQKNSFKPFPCGIVIHPVIDACVQLRRRRLKKDDVGDVRGVSSYDDDDDNNNNIERIDLTVHPLVLELTGNRTPKDGLEAKFSVYHGAAVGLVFGKATPAQYQDAVVTSQEVVAMREKIEEVRADEKLRTDECFVKVTLRDGRVVESHVEHAVGSLEVPMTRQLLEEKFVDQCTPVLGREGAMKASELAWSIENVEDVGELARRL